jgi:hypothetical protein
MCSNACDWFDSDESNLVLMYLSFGLQVQGSILAREHQMMFMLSFLFARDPHSFLFPTLHALLPNAIITTIVPHGIENTPTVVSL